MKKLTRITAVVLMLALLITMIPAVQAAGTISKLDFQQKWEAFLADPRWQHGTSWGYYQSPKIGAWGSIGCCSFAVDFTAYVYGSPNKAWYTSDFTEYRDVNDIRTGDIIHTATHWFVVLERDGNTLYTAEGNWGSKVRVTDNGWGLRDGRLVNLPSENPVTFDRGFHYNFSDVAENPAGVNFMDLSGQMSVSATDATIALRLVKNQGTSLTAYGARLYDVNGVLLGATESTPGSTYTESTFVDMWYKVSERFGLRLTPRTDYQFEFWATVDGETYTGYKRCFTTSAVPSDTSDSQIYYPLDFSDGLLACLVPGEEAGISTLASLEAWLYDARTQEDRQKVLDAVTAAYGNVAGEDAEDWSAVGYAQLGYSLQNLYHQLEQGYAAPVYRTAQDGRQWALVCGYEGSETKLEESGFWVINPDSGEKTTLDQWLTDGKAEGALRRKNGVLVSGLSDGIRMAINHPPVVHPYRNYQSVFGWVTSDRELSQVRVTVTSLTENKVILDKSLTLSADKRSATVHQIDNSMALSSWKTGKYYYTVLARDTAGEETACTHYFEIASGWPMVEPNPVYTLAYHGGVLAAELSDSTGVLNGKFTLRGSNQFVTSSYMGDALRSILTFEGWYAQRCDGKWYADDDKWYTQEQLSAKGIGKALLAEGFSDTLDSRWVEDCLKLGGYTFYAVWRVGDKLYEPDDQAPQEDEWFCPDGNWYFISSQTTETTLPQALKTVTDLEKAVSVNVYLEGGKALTVNIPMDPPAADNTALRRNSDGTATALNTLVTATGVQVTVEESCSLAVVSNSGIQPPQEEIATTPMYRLYNPNSGEHFYTGSTAERDDLVTAGWAYEGIAWNAPTNGGDPVYRLYNPNSGDHHYTMSGEERDMLVTAGWNYEGVAWNSAPSDHKDSMLLFRLYNPNADCGSHHYTGSTEERDFLVSIGWIYEGIGWFGLTK